MSVAFAQKSVFKKSEAVDVTSVPVKGLDLDEPGVDANSVADAMFTTGFMATHFAKAEMTINKFLSFRTTPKSEGEKVEGPIIILTYTSNMVSCGVRDIICYLAKHHLVDAFVTTAGGVEEDFIKCLGDTHLGDFRLSGAELREKGINRIGNLTIPNNNYVLFEHWILPVLDKMKKEQIVKQGKTDCKFCPSTLVDNLGAAMDNERSIYHWAHINDIPCFSPSVSDGSVGDMLFFHSYSNSGLHIDMFGDQKRIIDGLLNARAEGKEKRPLLIISIGGGTSKHFAFNASTWIGGADAIVHICDCGELDGSDTGAELDEAVACGKLTKEGLKDSIKITTEASLVFPLLVVRTFVKAYNKDKEFWDHRSSVFPRNDSKSYYESSADKTAEIRKAYGLE